MSILNYNHYPSTKLPRDLPTLVDGDFNCYFGDLKTMVGSPITVNGKVNFHNNYIQSMEGCPQYVSGHLDLSNNRIKSLCNLNIKAIHGRINLSYNPIEEGGLGLLLIKGLTFIEYHTDSIFTDASNMLNYYLTNKKTDTCTPKEVLQRKIEL